jgi:GDP-L-fucose synthase
MQNHDDGGIVNVGAGEDISIADLARLIARVVGYSGRVAFDTTKPDGTPRKLLDTSRLHAAGWTHRIGLEEGIRSTYQWFQELPRAS